MIVSSGVPSFLSLRFLSRNAPYPVAINIRKKKILNTAFKSYRIIIPKKKTINSPMMIETLSQNFVIRKGEVRNLSG